MNSWKNTTSVVLGGLSLLLTVTLIGLGVSNQYLQKSLQEELQKNQPTINQGQLSQQFGTAIIRDMAAASVNNSKMKDVLAKHGITVNFTPNSNTNSGR